MPTRKWLSIGCCCCCESSLNLLMLASFGINEYVIIIDISAMQPNDVSVVIRGQTKVQYACATVGNENFGCLKKCFSSNGAL